MIWFLADPHFGHENIIKMCGRPFANADEMDNILIGKINEYVQPKDTMYILGDYCYWRGDNYLERATAYRNRMKCDRIWLIRGNHDLPEIDAVFPSSDLLHIEIDKQSLVMCHYPMRAWHRSHYGSFHLYGHVHDQFGPWPNALDVSVESAIKRLGEARPFNWEDVKKHIGS
jgi:calcineurin-like phosphoesterase family protein